jgi:NADH:ubiquinone oxidoreductase subunit 5 (subunit L)/multisubunit Na+/H+ antiporter MnhA subunit
MHINFALNGQAFTSLPTLLFAVAFILGGAPVYLVYLRQRSVPKDVAKIGSALGHILDRGFYFDYVYEIIVARGALKLGKSISTSVEESFNTALFAVARGAVKLGKSMNTSIEESANTVVFAVANGAVALCRGVNTFVEKAFDVLTYAVAKKAAEASGFVYHHIDLFLDGTVYLFAARVLSLEPRFQKLQRGTLARYVAAALLGLLIIIVFIILVVFR